MNIRDHIISIIETALLKEAVPTGMVSVKVDRSSRPEMGDYATNVAFLLGRELGATTKKPIDLARALQARIEEEIKKKKDSYIERVEAVEPGYINFFLTKKFFTETIASILSQPAQYGKNTRLWNQRIIIEYTDPNAFKPLHIGHVMSNAIGESLSRIFEYHDAKVTRATYGSDIGLNVAMAVWGLKAMEAELPRDASEKIQSEFLGRAYLLGAKTYEEDEAVKKEVQEMNKKLFARSDEGLNALYDWGKRVSVAHFAWIYKKLGSHFDYQWFESEIAEEGKAIIEKHQAEGVFQKSEGAIIFSGETYGLHNRVFITSQGLPTYEAKELALNARKFTILDFDSSIVITGNEQNDYFKVIMKVLECIAPASAKKTFHIGHGMMRLSSGKMSSRKGNVVTGESLIVGVEEMVLRKMKDQPFTGVEKNEIAEIVAVGAIKYSVLRQAIGRDSLFDSEAALSFEGDSGPYLQYTAVRANAILSKAKEAKIKAKAKTDGMAVLPIERLLSAFPEVVERAGEGHAPQLIATYLIELAGEFNRFYAKTKIVDKKDSDSPYKVALAESLYWTVKNGLWLLGIKVPAKM